LGLSEKSTFGSPKDCTTKYYGRLMAPWPKRRKILRFFAGQIGSLNNFGGASRQNYLTI
jgi:hypothetical protein